MENLSNLKSIGYKTAIRYIQWVTYAATEGIYEYETVHLVNEYEKNGMYITFTVNDY